jgi:hypothetical protein
MKVIKDSANISITFEKQDWGNNLARDTISWLKKERAQYMPMTKVWKLPYTERYYTKLSNDANKFSFDDAQEDLDLFLSQFDE